MFSSDVFVDENDLSECMMWLSVSRCLHCRHTSLACDSDPIDTGAYVDVRASHGLKSRSKAKV